MELKLAVGSPWCAAACRSGLMAGEADRYATEVRPAAIAVPHSSAHGELGAALA